MRYFHTHLHFNTIHQSQKAEAIQGSTGKWINNQNMVFIPNAILWVMCRWEISNYRKTHEWCSQNPSLNSPAQLLYTQAYRLELLWRNQSISYLIFLFPVAFFLSLRYCLQITFKWSAWRMTLSILSLLPPEIFQASFAAELSCLSRVSRYL